MTFAQLINPIAEDVFFSNFWERESIHIERHDQRYFDSLLTIGDLDTALSHHLLRQQDCRLTKETSILPPQEYTSSASPKVMHDVIDGKKIHSFFLKGYTVIFEAAHRWHPPLNRLTNTLFSELSHLTQCNIYLTPPHSYGFGPHFDTHDVLILQVHGEKQWKLYGTPIELPLISQSKMLTSLPNAPSHELTLKPGETLYIPRGLVHDADTVHGTSVHITVGINVYTWHHFIQESVSRAAHRHVDFRRALPVGFLRNPERIQDLMPIHQALKHLHSQISEDLVSHLAPPDYPGRGVPLHGEPLLLEAVHADSLTLQSAVSIKDNRQFDLQTTDSEVVLEGDAICLAFPLAMAEVLSYILTERQFRVESLPSLDDESKVILGKRLVKEGCLQLI